ncbi:unnamed protein product, partial [marine sediment metagenome]
QYLVYESKIGFFQYCITGFDISKETWGVKWVVKSDKIRPQQKG